MKEPVWLLKSAVVSMQEMAIAEHGGLAGFRDEGLLDSALSRPQNLLIYETPDVFDLAAAYGFGIVKNHPFLDGNKRAGFLATRVFLLRNGYTLGAGKKEKVEVFLKLAASLITENQLSQWLRENAVKIA